MSDKKGCIPGIKEHDKGETKRNERKLTKGWLPGVSKPNRAFDTVSGDHGKKEKTKGPREGKALETHTKLTLVFLYHGKYFLFLIKIWAK